MAHSPCLQSIMEDEVYQQEREAASGWVLVSYN